MFGPVDQPDRTAAAPACEPAGASGITIHLRADRRHIQDRDVIRLRESINTKLNLEMGNTPEILDVALRVLPEEVCLVPENRAEVTTEGGLDAAGQHGHLAPYIAKLNDAGIRVSLFIAAQPAQYEAAVKLRPRVIEIPTGARGAALAHGEAYAAPRYAGGPAERPGRARARGSAATAARSG